MNERFFWKQNISHAYVATSVISGYGALSSLFKMLYVYNSVVLFDYIGLVLFGILSPLSGLVAHRILTGDFHVTIGNDSVKFKRSFFKEISIPYEQISTLTVSKRTFGRILIIETHSKKYRVQDVFSITLSEIKVKITDMIKSMNQ